MSEYCLLIIKDFWWKKRKNRFFNSIDNKLKMEKLWEKEYKRRGIPSSFRETPTRIVRIFVEKYKLSGNALDVGCGKGRNSIFLAQNGYNVYSIDFLPSVLKELDEKSKKLKLRINTICQNVTDPLPFLDDYFDLVIDIFCYKHQINSKKREIYRKEIKRILKPEGHFILSLAGKKDGFYEPLLKFSKKKNIIIDPYTKIASVLFTKKEIEKEFSDFKIVEYLRTSDKSLMHGRLYRRETLNFVMKKYV